jgi:PIN domain nuclease of toxin-antitoxin system
VRLLLDTHVAIWALTEPERIATEVTRILTDPASMLYVSAISVLEISIKHRLGKRGAPPFSGREAFKYFVDAGYSVLDVSAEHAAAVEELPLLHGDPFDRLLAAQAYSEPMRLVTKDRSLAAYSDTTITW